MLACPCASNALAQLAQFSSQTGLGISSGGLPTASSPPNLINQGSTTNLTPITAGGTAGSANISAPGASTPIGTTQQPIAPTRPPASAYGATIQQPRFDPFSTDPTQTSPPVLVAPPTTAFGSYGNPTVAPTPGYPPANASPYFTPNATYPGYPAQPSSMFPNWQPSGVAWPNGIPPGNYLRLFENRYLRYSWIRGNRDGNDVDQNDIDLGLTMNLPNFMSSGQPLKVTPVFIFHFWNGPSPPVTTSDLPSQAYSALVDLSWMTNPVNKFGAELSFAAGVYSDFSKVSGNSIRYTGIGLGWMKISPNVTVKGGIEYLDRARLKLLPGVGLFWQPNPDTRLDIYFPRPKIARRLRQLGNTDVWFYVRGEYGGGSWSIKRTSGAQDQADINDLRLVTGIEWKTLTNITGYVEAGYVFNREIYYRMGSPKLDLKDTFMLSGGFAF